MAKRTKKAGNGKVAVGYLRVSTDEQNLGPEAQRAAIEAWAGRQGITVVAWFEDHGVSGGAPLEKRTELMGAIDALARHGAGVLVVAKRDRLARDVVAVAMIESLVQRQGARVASTAGEGTDGDDPASLLMRRMIDAFAEYERQIIAARTKSALAVKKSKGQRVGTVSFGFRVADDGVSLIEDAGEQAIIRRVRDARSAGVPFRAIVAELREAGIVGRTGRPLGLAQVAGIAS